ncbi:MAG: P1 family peptidase [Clostridia bacterium]|nr:P1 family peptidase [Clostridia bacterium]
MKTITDISGIRVGHWSDFDAKTGCTAVLFDNGAVCGADVRGCAPGTRETDLLRGYNLVEKINAIMLCGGSAFGLDAASGAMRFLEEHNIGIDVGVTKVPIVPAAVIFDLAVGKHNVRPDQAAGYYACEAASKSFDTGSVGAGCGATIGKAYGAIYSDKGGIGTACIDLENGIKVAALIVVNALGDVYDPDSGKLLSGAHEGNRFLALNNETAIKGRSFTNTTIGIIATNATLTREGATKLAGMGHDGLALAIRPVHTTLDGDTLFGISTCEIDIDSSYILPILTAATKVAVMAIHNAVNIAP